jgi:hypothetical protein
MARFSGPFFLLILAAIFPRQGHWGMEINFCFHDVAWLTAGEQQWLTKL